MLRTQRITPFFWFNNQAEEAARFYTSIFRDSAIGSTARHPEGGLGPAGSVITVEFTLEGQRFIALNGGSQFSFTEAVSFHVACETQQEVDYYWQRLLDGGGTPQSCGWLKDRYGLSWQVVPGMLGRIFCGNAPQAGRVIQAMLKMQKLDIARLEAAAR